MSRGGPNDTGRSKESSSRSEKSSPEANARNDGLASRQLTEMMSGRV